jgi:hypothetical protein
VKQMARKKRKYKIIDIVEGKEVTKQEVIDYLNGKKDTNKAV